MIERFIFDRICLVYDGNDYTMTFLKGNPREENSRWIEVRNYNIGNEDLWGMVCMDCERQALNDTVVYYGRDEESICELLVEEAHKLGLCIEEAL